MLHEDRLAICGLCTNRGFSPKFGVVCSLTSERAAFKESCSDYAEDVKMVANKSRELEDLEFEKRFDTNSENIFKGEISDRVGASLEKKHGMNGRVIAGIVAIAIALLWFVLGIALIDRIFFYPIFLLGFGIYKIIDGVKKGNEKSRKEKSDILDL
jgi:hypothetical protein